MDDKLKKVIIDWIFENHMHHEDEDYACEDANYPYVNSLELEKFINSL